MALVLLCGRPCSGKTTVCDYLNSSLQTSSKTVAHITDPPSRHALFQSSVTEKTQRQRLRAATERSLLPNNIVLCDSLNYIKGMRYELYCAAKTSGIRYCVLYCDLAAEECIKLDKEREEGYGELIEGLCTRFEEPNERNRWDSPLFRVNILHDTWQRDVDRVRSWLLSPSSGKLVATMATRVPKKQGADVLGLLDAATREVENAMISALQGFKPGATIAIADVNAVIRLQRKPKLAELRAMRRSYLNLARAQPPSESTAAGLKAEYVAFVNEQLRARV